MGKIYIYYHIFCNEHTLPIVIEQTNKIIFSGLYNEIDTIYCFLVGDSSTIHTIHAFLNSVGKKFSIHDIGINDTSYERFTLLKIADTIQPDDKFLYLHTKGVTKPTSYPVATWRNLLDYFCIAKYKECLASLDTHDIVGALWKFHPWPHFSGNFWWSTGKYFLTLPKHIGDNYCDPEAYIGSANPNYRCLYQNNADFYYTPIPTNLFIDQ